jgi:hypothetical protein
MHWASLLTVATSAAWLTQCTAQWLYSGFLCASQHCKLQAVDGLHPAVVHFWWTDSQNSVTWLARASLLFRIVTHAAVALGCNSWCLLYCYVISCILVTGWEICCQLHLCWIRGKASSVSLAVPSETFCASVFWTVLISSRLGPEAMSTVSETLRGKSQVFPSKAVPPRNDVWKNELLCSFTLVLSFLKRIMIDLPQQRVWRLHQRLHARTEQDTQHITAPHHATWSWGWLPLSPLKTKRLKLRESPVPSFHFLEEPWATLQSGSGCSHPWPSPSWLWLVLATSDVQLTMTGHPCHPHLYSRQGSVRFSFLTGETVVSRKMELVAGAHGTCLQLSSCIICWAPCYLHFIAQVYLPALPFGEERKARRMMEVWTQGLRYLRLPWKAGFMAISPQPCQSPCPAHLPLGYLSIHLNCYYSSWSEPKLCSSLLFQQNPE